MKNFGEGFQPVVVVDLETNQAHHINDMALVRHGNGGVASAILDSMGRTNLDGDPTSRPKTDQGRVGGSSNSNDPYS